MEKHRKKKSIAARLFADKHIYVFLLPFLLFFAVYTVIPIAESWHYSFLKWNGFSAHATVVGLANFRELLHDHWFWNAMKNTFLFVVLAVPIRVIVSLLLAIPLNSRFVPFRNVFRTVIFTPVVTTGAIIGIVMSLILDPVAGPVVLFMHRLGLINSSLNLLGEGATAFPTAVIIWAWKWLGITLVYWLASLQTIPPELYEAAQIDGANAFHRFRHITVPLLIPFGVIIVLITAVDATRVFDLMLTLTGGGPYFSTEVIEIFIYRWAFEANIPRLGFASAAAALFGIAFMIFALLQTLLLRIAQRRRSRMTLS